MDSLFSFRGALLAIISIIFTGIMIAFFIVNRRLRYDSGGIEALQQHGSPWVHIRPILLCLRRINEIWSRRHRPLVYQQKLTMTIERTAKAAAHRQSATA